ncbi:MAG: lipase [Sphingomonas sanxanigenens]|uniref:Lipase n=1 Tax=Sphingomonas sanxanigenens TaxID=397260 RepID=A0A2W5AFZ8_9SPHN|nr:MAG: lipase [Sphingomonas sanxanigenens]
MTQPNARPHFVRPDVQAFLAFLESIPGPKMHELDAPAARLPFVAMKDLLDLPAGALAIKRDLSTPDGIPLRYYDARATRDSGPVLVFFHGGGFVIGDLETHDGFCAEAARQLDMPVIAVDYRLAPEYPFPAAPEDCEAAARWIAGSPADLGLKVTSLVFAGDSAGGNLTIATTQTLRDRPAAAPVIAQWPIYPVVDEGGAYGSYEQFGQGYLLTEDSMAWFMNHYAAEPEDPRNYVLRQNHEGTPPTLVITAGLDPLRDQGRAYAAALIEAGVDTVYREASGNIHGFITLRKAIPSGIADLDACFRILKDMVAEAEAMREEARAAA